MIQVGQEQHEIIVPEGAHGGQVLTCMIVPYNTRPGMEVVVMMKQGEMAVTIPDMAPGEVLIVDVGGGLEQYVEQESWAPMEMVQGDGCRRAMSICACLSVVLLFFVLISSMMRPHHPYGGGGYGGGYGQYGTNPAVSQYHQHLLDNRNVAYGASPPAPLDPNLDPDAFPGKEDGFERGTDESGAEVYRYEQNNQVYVIPANDYYSWRSEHYHGHLTQDILTILLVSHLYRTMMYPHGMYYGAGGMYGGFHRPVGAYYSSAAYQSHYSNPVRGPSGQTTYPRSNGGGAAAGGRTGTPVAQARPVATARPVGGTPNRGTPTAAARPVSRPVANARPVSRPSGGGWSSARGHVRSGRTRG